MTYRIGSLCSGYEGLGAAVMDVLGGELAWVADNDPGASAILAHRFPSVKNLGDITEVRWETAEPVDVLCAGFPCQDISAAGKRAGLRRGTRSGLWHEIASAIGVLRPGLVVIENVRALLTARGDDPTPEHLAAEASRDATTRLLEWLDNEQNLAYSKGDRERVRECRTRTIRVMGLRKRAVARCQWHERRLVRAIGTVLGSLADLGYDARWVTVSASEARAPHKRERVFILAWPAADTDGRRREDGPQLGGYPSQAAANGHSRWRHADGHPGAAAPEDPDRAASSERRLPAPGQAPGGRPRTDTGGPGGAPPADTDDDQPHQPEGVDRATDERAAAGRPVVRPGGRAPADAGGARLGEHAGEPLAQEARTLAGDKPSGDRGLRPAADWGPYQPAISRWERELGRAAPRPTEPGRTGERLSPRFVEWLMGLPEGWVTDVPGLSRNAHLKALGNGVVPAQAAMALRLLLGAIEREAAA